MTTALSDTPLIYWWLLHLQTVPLFTDDYCTWWLSLVYWWLLHLVTIPCLLRTTTLSDCPFVYWCLLHLVAVPLFTDDYCTYDCPLFTNDYCAWWLSLTGVYCTWWLSPCLLRTTALSGCRFVYWWLLHLVTVPLFTDVYYTWWLSLCLLRTNALGDCPFVYWWLPQLENYFLLPAIYRPSIQVSLIGLLGKVGDLQTGGHIFSTVGTAAAVSPGPQHHAFPYRKIWREEYSENTKWRWINLKEAPIM